MLCLINCEVIWCHRSWASLVEVMALLLTHWGRVTHICISKLTIIGSDNGLLPGWRQAIIRTNAGILLIGPLGTNFSEILIQILTFSFTKMRLKVLSAKWRPFCPGLNVLTQQLEIHEAIAESPGHQYPQLWLNCHRIQPVLYKTNQFCTKLLDLQWTTSGNEITFWNKMIQLLKA